MAHLKCHRKRGVGDQGTVRGDCETTARKRSLCVIDVAARSWVEHVEVSRGEERQRENGEKPVGNHGVGVEMNRLAILVWKSNGEMRDEAVMEEYLGFLGVVTKNIATAKNVRAVSDGPPLAT
jgi:hypothetical protein